MISPTTGVGFINGVTTTLKAILELRRTVGNKEAEKKLESVYNTLWDLKTTAGQLEDENRRLREELRFKSGDYEFRPQPVNPTQRTQTSKPKPVNHLQSSKSQS